MTTSLATPPKLQFFDLNGAPLSGGKLYTYVAGTTTPQVTYTDYVGGTANTNPVILDSRGEASVWLNTPLYKMALYSATDVLIWTVDNIGGFATLAQLAASGGSNLIGFLQAGTGAVATTVQTKLRESVSVLDFGAVGDGVADDGPAIQAALTYINSVGGGSVLIPGVPTFYAVATSPLIVGSNTHVIFEGWLKQTAASVGGGFMGTDEGSTGSYIENVKIDCNNIYSGVSGENGFGFGGSKHKMIGGTIKNCAKGYGNASATQGDGGKGIQNETEYNDIVVEGVTFENCFMAISTRQEHIVHAYECGPQIFSNITAQNCNIFFFVEYAGVGSVPDGKKHSVVLNGFSARNCGNTEGVFQFSNAGNVLVSDGIIVNTTFTTPAFIRGRHRYCSFDNVQFSGNCTNIISNTIGTYCPLTALSEQNNYNIQHIGTISTAIGSSVASDRALTNSTINLRIDTDPTSGLVDTEVDDASTFCVITLDGKVLRGSTLFISTYYGTFAAVGWSGDVIGNCAEGSWTPTITSSAGTITTIADVVGLYRKVGRQVTLFLTFTISNNGTGSGYLNLTTTGLPASVTPPTLGTTGGFTENNATGFMGYIYNPGSGGNPLYMFKYDNTYPGATNGKYSCVINYTVAT